MQCLENIKAIIKSVDRSLAGLARVNISVKETEELVAVDDVYQTYFPEGASIRRVIGVTDLPKGTQIQIETIAGNAEGMPPIGQTAEETSVNWPPKSADAFSIQMN